MLETGNMGCHQGKSCVADGEPIEDRSQFGIWCIISAPLVLSVDLTNAGMLDRVWPIVSNREAIAVNQHWNGSPGQLLLTDRVHNPTPLNAAGYYAYPAQLGQSRGWEDVAGMTGPPHWQVGPCVDEWTGGPCTTHYMTLWGGPMNVSLAAADAWCNANSSCHGYTFGAEAYGKAGAVTPCYFRDETQIFFMDSTLTDLATHLSPSPPGRPTAADSGGDDGEGGENDGTAAAAATGRSPRQPRWVSHVKAERAPPLSPATSGLQVWVKDIGSNSTGAVGLALLLVNLGQTALTEYKLPLAKLPPAFLAALGGGKAVRVRDVWSHSDVAGTVGHGGALEFHDVAPHDSVFYVLSPAGHDDEEQQLGARS